MATDYGADLAALDDLPLSDAYVSGAENLAYALGRRLLTPEDGYGDCGDPGNYQSLDIREQIGARLSDAEQVALAAQCRGAASQDDRVLSAVASLEVTGGAVVASIDADGDEGPFSLILTAPPDSSATLETT